MTDISEAILASVWRNYWALGCDRLILSGVMTALDDAKAWIARAVPDADFAAVRLAASEQTLWSRVEKREVPAAAEDQMRRTLRQVRQISRLEMSGVIELRTDGKTPKELASEVLRRIDWLSAVS
jgi:hypothetical protein